MGLEFTRSDDWDKVLRHWIRVRRFDEAYRTRLLGFGLWRWVLRDFFFRLGLCGSQGRAWVSMGF